MYKAVQFRFRTLFFFLIILTIYLPVSQADAGGFAILEQSAEGVGKGFAGASAGYGDGSEIAFNPAAMSFVEGSVISHSSHLIIPSTKFHDTGSTNLATGIPVQGTKAPDAGGVIYVPNLYYVTPVDDHLTFGMGMHAPFGLKTEYDRTWTGRYQAVESELITVNFAPSLSYRVTDNWSVGAGLSVLYADATLSNSVDFGTIGLGTLGLPTASALGLLPQQADGFAEVKGDDWGLGYQIGTAYQYAPGSRVGLSYHSKIDLTLNGTGDFDVPANALPLTSTGLFTDTSGAADLTLPESINLGLIHQLNDQFSLLSEVQWTRWSRFKELRVDFGGVQPDSVVDENWHNTYRYSLALGYKASSDLDLTIGYTYDESPVPGQEFRTARIPDTDRQWLALGAKYAFTDNLDLVLSYAHLFVNDSNVSDVDGVGNNLVGYYDSSVDIISFGLNYKL